MGSFAWWVQRVCLGLNTLAGRLVFGPIVGTLLFWKVEIAMAWRGQQGRRRFWVAHICHVGLLGAYLLFICGMPLWLYACALLIQGQL